MHHSDKMYTYKYAYYFSVYFSIDIYLQLKTPSKKLSVIHSSIQLDKTDSQCQQKSTFVYNKDFKDCLPKKKQKTSKHFDQYGSHDVETFHFGDIGQFTDTITRF